MRQARSTLVLNKQRVVTAAVAAVLISPVWAGVKLSDSDPLYFEKSRLKTAGWAGTFGPNLPMHSIPDKVELLRIANQLLDRSANYLPKEIVAKVSREMKQEIARVAEKVFARAILEEGMVVEIGQTGLLRYKVGVLWYSGDTIVGGKRISSGWNLAPFVALMPAGRTRSMKAEITLFGMPSKKAEIVFDGQATETAAQWDWQRKYFTPLLEVGKRYQYEVVARWQENGKEVKRSRKVILTGGDAMQVNLYYGRWIRCRWKRYTGERKGSKDCSFAYSPDRKTILKVLETKPDAPKKVRLYNAVTNKPLSPEITFHETFPGKDPSTSRKVLGQIASPGERIVALAVAPDGKTIAVALSVPGGYVIAERHLAINQPDSERHTNVAVWDATTGYYLGYYAGPALSPVFDLSFFQNGKYVSISALPKKKK